LTSTEGGGSNDGVWGRVAIRFLGSHAAGDNHPLGQPLPLRPGSDPKYYGDLTMHKSFKPIDRILMGPGPQMLVPSFSCIVETHTGASRPAVHQLMDEIKLLLKYTFKTESEHICFIRSGSLGMEACLVNLVEPGSKLWFALQDILPTG
jgi:hypothetical protein